MKLSIVVANSSRSQLLEQSISSLNEAGKGIEYEIFVVENDSSDRSAQMVLSNFPDVKFISNESKAGVSASLNQAIKASSGEYVFVVSPNTISNNNSLERALAFMDTHSNTGGISLRMITPMGDFIKESKYTLSKPWIAMLKWSGLHKYFSHSHIFKNPSADWIDEFETSAIDVLNGNCMFLRRSVLNNIGLFDERFSSYGHNIDLSYRIRLAGYKNYYYPHTYLISHQQPTVSLFSWTYISQYYGVMFIFAAKYLFRWPVINFKTIGELIPSSYEVER